MADLVSKLSKQNFDIDIIMTKNATNFMSPLIFEALSGNRCIVDTFENNFIDSMAHIKIAKKADLLVIAPATANIIAKISNGIADDILSTTVLACSCPKIVAPAMNTNMLLNEITLENINKLKQYGFHIIESEEGVLACKDKGLGKLANIETIYQNICYHSCDNKDFFNKNVLVTAGPTLEDIDPVRFISNPSSGKMGYSIAKSAMLRGANVTLISGPTNLEKPLNVNFIEVRSSKEMFNEVKLNYKSNDIIIKSAAVSDYTPVNKSSHKLKKHEPEITIDLKKTDDILAYLGKNKFKNQILCGFCMETENLIENAKIKLNNKNLDMIVANSLNMEGSGFGFETNIVSIITCEKVLTLDKLLKIELADIILDNIKKIRSSIC